MGKKDDKTPDLFAQSPAPAAAVAQPVDHGRMYLLDGSVRNANALLKGYRESPMPQAEYKARAKHLILKLVEQLGTHQRSVAGGSDEIAGCYEQLRSVTTREEGDSAVAALTDAIGRQRLAIAPRRQQVDPHNDRALANLDIRHELDYMRRVTNAYHAQMREPYTRVEASPALRRCVGRMEYTLALHRLGKELDAIVKEYDIPLLPVAKWEGEASTRNQRIELAVQAFEHTVERGAAPSLLRRPDTTQVVDALRDLREMPELDVIKEQARILKVEAAQQSRFMIDKMDVAYRQDYSELQRLMYNTHQHGGKALPPFKEANEAVSNAGFEACWARNADAVEDLVERYEAALANPDITPDGSPLGQHTQALDGAGGKGGRTRRRKG